jgi:2-dehydro-3-deoxygluconokinase
VTVVCAGEALAAIRAQARLRLGGTAKLSIAGSEANVAIGLSRLGIRSSWVGVVGDDELGALIRRTLQGEGVDCSAVRTDPDQPTGLIVFEPMIGKRTRAQYYRRDSAGAQLQREDIDRALKHVGESGVTAVVTSGITPALAATAADAARALLETAHRLGVPACLSVNYRAALWPPADAARALAELIELASILIASDGELPIAAGQTGARPDCPEADKLARELLHRGPAEVVVTRGAHGACAYDGARRYDQPALDVPVIDTVGAGDAFTSGYLAGRLAHAAIPDSLRQGVTTAAFCVAVEGDWEGLPTQRDIELLSVDPGEVLR